MGTCPSPKMLKGLRLTPASWSTEPTMQTHAPSTRSQGMLFSHSRRMQASASFLKKCSAS